MANHFNLHATRNLGCSGKKNQNVLVVGLAWDAFTPANLDNVDIYSHYLHLIEPHEEMLEFWMPTKKSRELPKVEERRFGHRECHRMGIRQPHRTDKLRRR